MIDGTERKARRTKDWSRHLRPIQRPIDPKAQTLNYSGKKKRPTRKHLAAVDETKGVIVLSKAQEGKLHDKRFHAQDDIASNGPESIPIEVILGFQGLQNQYENSHPPKKPRAGALSAGQKQEHPCWSESRVIWENAFAGVKGDNAVSVVYRNRIVDFDDHLMLTAAGLGNF